MKAVRKVPNPNTVSGNFIMYATPRAKVGPLGGDAFEDGCDRLIAQLSPHLGPSRPSSPDLSGCPGRSLIQYLPAPPSSH